MIAIYNQPYIIHRMFRATERNIYFYLLFIYLFIGTKQKRKYIGTEQQRKYIGTKQQRKYIGTKQERRYIGTKH